MNTQKLLERHGNLSSAGSRMVRNISGDTDLIVTVITVRLRGRKRSMVG